MPLPTSLVVKNGSKIRGDRVARNAAAGVGNRQRDEIALQPVVRGVAAQPDRPHRDLDHAAIRHGIARIDREIEHGEFELALVDAHRRDGLRHVDP